ncbi:MAG: hypothetical protein ACUVQG_12760 [Thermogutta sp.]
MLALAAAFVAAPAAQVGFIFLGTDPLVPSYVELSIDESLWSFSADSAASGPVTPPVDEPPRPELWLVLELQLAHPGFSSGLGMTSPCPVVSSSSAPIGGVAWYCEKSLELSPTCGWLRQEQSRLKKPLPPLWELLRPA